MLCFKSALAFGTSFFYTYPWVLVLVGLSTSCALQVSSSDLGGPLAGMVDVILKTNADDEGKQWTVDNYAEMSKTATKAMVERTLQSVSTVRFQTNPESESLSGELHCRKKVAMG